MMTTAQLNTIVTDTLSQEPKQALDAIQKAAFANVGQDEFEHVLKGQSETLTFSTAW
jgi:predicted component of type VI protein secretion system